MSDNIAATDNFTVPEVDGTKSNNAVETNDSCNNGDEKYAVSCCGSHIMNQLRRLFAAYEESIKNSPLLTKSITSSIIAMVGEIIASYIKNTKLIKQQMNQFNRYRSPSSLNAQSSHLQILAKSIDIKRLALFGSFGLVVVGPIFHYWYNYLEKLSDAVTSSIIGCIKHFSNSKTTNDSDVDTSLYTYDKVRDQVLKLLVKLGIQQVIFTPAFVLFTLAYLQFFLTHGDFKSITKSIKNTYVAIMLTNWKVWTPAQAVNFTVVPLKYRVLYGSMVALWWNIYLSLSSP